MTSHELALGTPPFLAFQHSPEKSSPHICWPVSTLKPKMVQGCQHWSHLYGSIIRLELPSTGGLLVCASRWAELLESGPQSSVPVKGKGRTHHSTSGGLVSWRLCQLLCLTQESGTRNLSVQGPSGLQGGPC